MKNTEATPILTEIKKAEEFPLPLYMKTKPTII
jgi:hypothetical protein